MREAAAGVNTKIIFSVESQRADIYSNFCEHVNFILLHRINMDLERICICVYIYTHREGCMKKTLHQSVAF